MAEQPITQQSLQAQPHAHNAPRPFGLKAIMTLLVLQIIAGIGIIALFAISVNLPPDAALDDLDDFLYAMPFYVAQQSLLALLRLVCVVGLWRLKRWAWFLMMLLLTYSMAVDIIAHFRGNVAYLSMFFNVMMVFYLNQREVQQMFARRPADMGRTVADS